MERLREEFDFTVFSTVFDNPDPSRIDWVQVPAIRRPLAALYGSYYLTSTIRHAIRRRRPQPYDLTQSVEGYTASCDISYAHFCHTAYLRNHAADVTKRSLRGAVRHLDHRLRAVGERAALSRPRLVVVPSPELRDELHRELGLPARKLRVISNPVDIEGLAMPKGFARGRFRSQIGVSPDDVLAIFVALGHFERKGLPQLLEAMACTSRNVQLMVVGGSGSLTSAYSAQAARQGVSDRVRFLGMQTDVRPYLWCADVFVSPSAYETFSLALHQAAAASLPLVVTAQSGAASFFRAGVHGLEITRNPQDIGTALSKVANMSAARRRKLGTNARKAVTWLDADNFAQAWRQTYREML